MTAESWQHSDSLAWVDVPDGIALVDLARLSAETVPLVLTGSAAAIWDAIDGTRSTAQVVEALAQQFDDVDPDDLARSTEHFLHELAERGLVSLRAAD